ncbi:MAG: hypothetical protein LQ345_002971 [Seirophora villosa]|nr:MAG: hypothetical protein LQ345_002971 [Seirophora villosa]
MEVLFGLQNAKGTLFTVRAPYCEHLTRSPSFWFRPWYTIPDDFSSNDNADGEDHSDDAAAEDLYDGKDNNDGNDNNDDHNDVDDDDDDNDDDDDDVDDDVDDDDDDDDSIDSESETDGLERKRKREDSGSTPNKRVKR